MTRHRYSSLALLLVSPLVSWRVEAFDMASVRTGQGRSTRVVMNNKFTDWTQGAGGDVSDEGVYWSPEVDEFPLAPVSETPEEELKALVVGDLWSVQGAVLAQELPSEPSADMSAYDMIVALLRGLQFNDVPHANAGLERCYAFTDLACKKLVTGHGNGTIHFFPDFSRGMISFAPTAHDLPPRPLCCQCHHRGQQQRHQRHQRRHH
mmetsp:Transcript_24271/g.65633  ORF Transcript_24271/g.65633 Transcript_24271/m.65633 type:complete len:207 (+) Transcript_24271:465-1085(+)